MAEELKISRMYKKSQNKRLFSRENLYKLREFVLTSKLLKYFDICGGNRGKLKGVVNLAKVKFVEKLSEEILNNKSFVLQIGYVEGDCGSAVCVLYVVSSCEEEREDWIELLRHYCKENSATLQPRYHPGIWSKVQGKYTCCGDICRMSMGCALVDGVKNEALRKECEAAVALFDFVALQEGQLCLRKGERYLVVDSSNKEWWYLQDDAGERGYAPQSHVEMEDDLRSYSWFHGDISRQEAECRLLEESREGCFLVRSSSSGGLTLSLSARHGEAVKIHHYRIRRTEEGGFFVSEKYVRGSVAELVECHRHNSGGLVVRLRSVPLSAAAAAATGGTVGRAEESCGLDEFEVDVKELKIEEVPIGQGQFGVVKRGSLRGMSVAVKLMVEGAMNEQDFVDEARNMRCLNHPNLVRLFAVVLKTRPVMIVTEYMKHGSLRDFLRSNYSEYCNKTNVLVDSCAQIASGMCYLEQRNFVHRDLAARNVLVSCVQHRPRPLLTVKVSDFGMTRFLLDNVYEPSAGTKFPVRWAAPEVFQSVYTSRADVWSYGVLLWELFTLGLQLPYSGYTNSQVYSYILGGGRLSKPSPSSAAGCLCPDRLYVLMLECWQHDSSKRPGFLYISSKLTEILSELL